MRRDRAIRKGVRAACPTGTRLVTAGLSYLCLIGLLTWQALGGQPVISPDARMLVALVALVLTAGTAASAVVLGAWRGGRCDRNA